MKFTIPQLAKMLEEAKAEKAKTVVPKFKIGDWVCREGYSNYNGEIEAIDIEIKDDGEPWITYTVDRIGIAWECELEESTSHEYVDYFSY